MPVNRSVLWRAVSLVAALTLLAGCSQPASSGLDPTAQEPALPTSAPAPAAAGQETPQPAAPESPGTLRLWVPPQFDPSGNTPAAQILRQRLNEFSRQNPDVTLDVRVKAVDGPGGLLDSLTTASAAAPGALPDLVALPRELMETAALKGLLYPYDPLSEAMQDGDWYDYAQSLSKLQQSVYGLPFAGDALAVIHRPSVQPAPTLQTTSTLTTTSAYPMVFAAADPQNRVTLALVQAGNGRLRDEQGRPTIDTQALTNVLAYYAGSRTAGGIPEWITQFQNDDDVWQAYADQRSDAVITWASRLLKGQEQEAVLAPLSQADGQPFTQATGWVWGLASRSDERRQMAAELAEFLTESAFLADWTPAAGYLPPRPSALEGWENTALSGQIDLLARSAVILPPADVVEALSKPFWQATLDVFNGSSPAEAAQAAAASLTAP